MDTKSQNRKIASFYFFLAAHVLITGWLFSEYAGSAVANKYLNKNIFAICVIFAAYSIAKGTIVHKVMFCGNVLLDFFVERILIPIVMAISSVRLNKG